MKIYSFLGFVFSFGICFSSNAQIYCSSEGVITTYEWIEKVQLSTFQYSSGNNDGYGDFTNQVISLSQLAKPTIKLTPGASSTNINPTEYWRVWIDFNRDADFSESNELVFDSNGTSENMVEAELFIPYDAVPGPTRMRVAMKYVSPEAPELPQACGGFLYGEVEDYTINIIEIDIPLDTFNTSINEIVIPRLELYPNPTSDLLNWKTLFGTASLKNIECYDIKGNLVAKISSNTHFLDVSNFTSGNYFFKAELNGKEIMERFVVVR